MTKKDTVQYSMGMLLAKDLNSAGITEINKDLIIKAIEDQLKGETMVDAQEARSIIEKFKLEVQIAEGANFLAENAKKEGVVTLPSGLQYSVINAGTGTNRPSLTSKVTTHYHGMLIDGSVFDSSVDRGEPLSFKLQGVIKGWQEALQLMTPGDKWRLYIPYDLAYGSRGAGGVIPPYAALIFDVELLSFE